MLSRHAEGLFWTGRYVERAADVTRMLDVAYNRQLERTVRGSSEVWRDLLRVLYLEDEYAKRFDGEISTGAMNRFLVFDSENPSSVMSSIREARTNVMSFRDIVPIELLDVVNRAHGRMVSRSLERFADHTPHEIYDTVTGLCRTITGAIDEAMPRDDGYRFLVIGRMIERAEMTCRMIDVNRVASGTDVSSWMTVLRSVSGFHAFVRDHGPLAPVDEVVRYMLLERSFPFSVLHGLSHAAALAEEVIGTGNWKSPHVLGRVSTRLEYADIPPVDSDSLEDFLQDLEEAIREVSEAVHQDLYQFGGEVMIYSFEAL